MGRVGRMFARMKGTVARYETEHKSVRQRNANRQRAKNGKVRGAVPAGSPPPVRLRRLGDTAKRRHSFPARALFRPNEEVLGLCTVF